MELDIGRGVQKQRLRNVGKMFPMPFEAKQLFFEDGGTQRPSRGRLEFIGEGEGTGGCVLNWVVPVGSNGLCGSHLRDQGAKLGWRFGIAAPSVGQSGLDLIEWKRILHKSYKCAPMDFIFSFASKKKKKKRGSYSSSAPPVCLLVLIHLQTKEPSNHRVIHCP